jgi:hypothetical protein
VVILFEAVRERHTIFAQDITAAALNLRLWNVICIREIHHAEVVIQERAPQLRRQVC